MNWAWRFGMIVLSGVPAIIGGGITYGFTESWTGVVIWEAIVLVLLVTVLIKGGSIGGAHAAVPEQRAH